MIGYSLTILNCLIQMKAWSRFCLRSLQWFRIWDITEVWRHLSVCCPKKIADFVAGLTIIAGHLLLQSPEEDAFWTFLAMMDSYLRPYFMPTSPLMTVDTSLFVKAVEAMDHHFATRLFAELNVRPLELCGVWYVVSLSRWFLSKKWTRLYSIRFSSVFAGSLPLPHLHRVWDLFFYDGMLKSGGTYFNSTQFSFQEFHFCSELDWRFSR